MQRELACRYLGLELQRSSDPRRLPLADRFQLSTSAESPVKVDPSRDGREPPSSGRDRGVLSPAEIGRTRPRDDGASDSRLFPGYVLCFPVSKRKFPGSTNVNEFIK